MKKILLIGWKDLKLVFRDRAALIMMLAAPFLLTMGLGLVTGRFSGSSSTGISQIPVVIVNQDGQQLGDALVSVFQSEELAELIALNVVADPAQARAAVDGDEASAAVMIPVGFTESIFAIDPSTEHVVAVEVYSNPTRPTGAGVVKTIVEQFLNRVELGRVNGVVTVTVLVEGGYIDRAEAAQFGADIGARSGEVLNEPLIALSGVIEGEPAPEFDVLAYMAPAMALMFLMFTVSNGGRTILAEQTSGTLPRLLVAPLTMTQVLAGKTLGIFLTGAAQMFILIGGMALLFQIHWGNWFAVILLTLSAVFGALGWGLLLTALAKNQAQVATFGSAMMLVFGLLSGSFTDPRGLPAWWNALSRITPNAWALQGFTGLALGQGLRDILLPVSALLLMGLILFGITVFIFLRRGGLQRG